ncbi:MAG: molybdenum cofactor guanylyltransferase [Myxococcota bacterium]
MGSLAAIVLAGGASRRMGRDKALLDRAGQPLVRFVCDVARSVCDPVIVVHGATQELGELEGVRLVPDPPERGGGGPLCALLTGLEVLTADFCFLTGVDAPRLSVAHIEALYGRRGLSDAVVPVDGEFRLTLSSLVRSEPVREVASRLVEQGERSLRALFRALRVEEVALRDLPDPSAVANVNTLAEWEELLKRL